MKNQKSQKNQKLSIQSSSDYNKAMKHIMCAISALGDKAKSGDNTARDAVANLSVVLFDLK